MTSWAHGEGGPLRCRGRLSGVRISHATRWRRDVPPW